MKIRLFDTYDALSAAAAEEILVRVREKSESVLCLAAGDSPLKAYQILVEQSVKRKIDFSKVHFVGLDEWVGVSPQNPGSCRFFLAKNLFEPLKIDEHHVHLFDAFSPDIIAECGKMDKTIVNMGGIDLMIVGIGMNGHVGFNEPGVSSGLHAHVIQLDEVTQSVGQKYFSQPTKLRQGITLGLQTISEAKSVILLANGEKKANIIKKSLEEDITVKCPASILRYHSNSYAFLDSQAASKLSLKS
jgi:glucosamine-6-phosphate isomerase